MINSLHFETKHHMNMARFLSAFITWSFLLILSSKGSPEIGFSARLKSNVEVKRSQWTPVRGWEDRGSQLLFEYGIKLDKSKKESAKIPLNGIFLISANLNITSKNETKLKACITQKSCITSDQNENTIIIATLVHLLRGEKVMVKLHGSESFIVQKDSSFAVQYLGSASRPPGFMATLQSDQSIQSNALSGHTVKKWVKQGTHYTQNNLERDWPASFEKLSVSCSGVYLLSATLSFEAVDGKYEVTMKSNSNKTLTKDIKIFRHKGIATVTLFNQFQLQKSEELSVHMRGPSTGSIKILNGSSFNAVYIGPVKSKLAEFSVKLPNDVSFKAGQNSERLLMDYLPQKIIDEKGIKVTKRSKQYQISMPKHGVYVISLHLNVNMSPNDKLTTRVFVFKEGLKTTTSVNGRLYSQRSGGFQEISLLLTGVLTLQSLNFITISFELSSQKSFQILRNSRISFTAVRSHDLAASFTIEKARIAERSLVRRPGLALNATQSFAFPLNEFVNSDKREFKCTLRGIYQISLNVVISGRKGAPKDVNLQVFRRTSRQDLEATVSRDPSSSHFTSILNVSVTVREGLATITPLFLYNLEDDDLLSFHVYSNSKIEVLEKSSLFMSLVDFIEAGRIYIASLPRMPNKVPLDTYGEYPLHLWLAKTAGSVAFSHQGGDHIAPKTGYYTISTYLQIKSTFKIDISNLDLTLFVYFDDKNRNFGLQDKVKVTAKINDTMNLLFTVNGIVEARKDARLRAVLKSSDIAVNLTAIAGQLSIIVHNQREDTPETFRNLQSSTKLLNLANGAWENIGKPIDDQGNGEFKSANVEILGLRFLAYKSLVAFASATTVVYGIDGTVEYGVVVHGSDVIKRKGLTVEAEVNSKSLTTLKWSGLVYMEPWQQLALAIRRKDGGVVSSGRIRARTSWSSFSFVAISFPESAEDINSKENSLRPNSLPARSDAWYLINKHYQPINELDSKSNEVSLQLLKKGDKFPVTTDNSDLQAISLPRFKLTRSENLKLNATVKVKGKSPYTLDELFSEIKTLRNYLLNGTEKGSGTCLVGLLSVKLVLHSEVNEVVSLVFRSAFNSVLSQNGFLRNETKTIQRTNKTMNNDANTIAASKTILEYNGVVCYDSFQTISVSSKSNISATITKDSKFSFALIDSLNNVEGFSAAQRANQVIALESDRWMRIDGWYVNHSFGFDSSTGFKEPFGSYVVPNSGKYLVTANLILRTKSTSAISLALYLDDGPIPQAVIQGVIAKDVVSTINLASLIKVDKWRLLQLKVKANISLLMTVLPGSTISTVLLDQDVALDRCESSLLNSQIANYRNKAYRIGADVVIPCGTKDSRIVDFYWLQDNRVVKFIPSSKDGTLVIRSATPKHSGIYVCRIQTGDYSVVSHKIKIFVYDPRPTIMLGNLTLFVPENSPPDQNLMDIKVKAKTSRETDDALVELSILPAGLNKTFYISPKRTNFSAVLKSSIAFDYESRDEYKITLKAVNKDFPIPELAISNVTLTVKVIDRNDNPPEFEKKSVVVSLLENATVGEIVHEVKASDKDTGVNAEVRYSIHLNRDSKYFGINEKTGKIKVKRPLAKDGRRYYTLFVIAKNKPYSAFIEIVVKVVDVNNHRPYFRPILYKANVTETTEIGSVITRVFAYDSDTEAINKRIVYKLDDSTAGELPISVDNDGNIHIIQKLRKYAGKILQYKVLAFDGIGLRGTNEATIILRVVKTSIMPSFSSGLRFSKDTYRVKVGEDADIGTVVTTVRAYNPDNSHYQLRYVLMKTARNDSFTISETSGEIFTSTKLDYETTKEYSLTVFACDVEGKSDCTVTKVIVSVENANDNPPKFSRLSYEISVNEDVKFGSSLLTVTATDADAGDHGNVKYALASRGTDLPFMIGETTGIVKVMGNLIALKANKCMFAVTARNGKEMKNAEEALIVIKVIRKKEKLDLVQLPSFEKDVYEVSISEDEKVGSKILEIKVSSLDSAAVSYALVANNYMTFETDKEKGGLILKKKLDYETTKTYDLILVAQLNDEITLRSSTRIVARVTDVNDNPPIFIQPNLETYLRGGITTGRLVTKIHAYDIDSGINSQLVYKFDSNLTISEFTLNPTNGDLRVNKLGRSRVFYLPIVACDKGIPSLCTRSKVTVHIAKDSYRGSLASSMLESNFTFMALEFDVDQYIPDPREEVKVRFIAQEIHENDPNHKIFSQLPPTTWYDVNYKRKEGNNYLRRYIASEEIKVLESDNRIRRGLSNQKMKKSIKFKYGDEDGCAEVWKANSVCNGPLRPGTKYRFQLEFGYKGSNSFLKTGFTKEYTTGPGPPAALEVKMVPKKHFPYWIALIATSASLLLVLIIIFICCCYHRIKSRRLRKSRFEVATQKDNTSGDYFMPWKTETESQELTVWFSEEKLADGDSLSKHSQNNIAKL